MVYIKQFGILVGIAFLGECVNKVIPLPIPGTVWGMLILFGLLISGTLKLEQVEKCADSLLGIMALLFVPLTVGLIESYVLIIDVLIPFIIIILLSTLVVFGVTGRVVQSMRRKREKGERGKEKEKDKKIEKKEYRGIDFQSILWLDRVKGLIAKVKNTEVGGNL